MSEKYRLFIEERLYSDKWLIRGIAENCSVDWGSGRILKAGESAGFLNPMGEGISSALESGYFVAHSVLSNFDDAQKVLDEYRNNAAGTLSYMKRQWNLVGKISDKFSNRYN